MLEHHYDYDWRDDTEEIYRWTHICEQIAADKVRIVSISFENSLGFNGNFAFTKYYLFKKKN